MLLALKTKRMRAIAMLVAGLVVASGHTSVAVLCSATEGPILAEILSHGCCHCPNGEAHDTQPDHRIALPHKHCVDLELPFDFLTIRLLTESTKLHSVPVNPLGAFAAAEETTYRSIISSVRDHPPWHDANHQTVTLLSTTVLLR